MPKCVTQFKETIRRANNTDLNEVMFEVSLDNTLTGLKQGKIAQTICRLVGSKTGKHKVKTLKGEAKKNITQSLKRQAHKARYRAGNNNLSNLGSICRDWQGACTLLEIIPPQTCRKMRSTGFKKSLFVTKTEMWLPAM